MVGGSVAMQEDIKELDGEVMRALGDISHDIKNLLQPIVSGVWLLESEIDDIFHKLPEVEAIKAEASHKLCDEVIEMLRSATSHIHDRVKEIADCVKDTSTAPRFAPCQAAKVVDEVFKTLRVLAEKNKVALRTDGLEHLTPIMADERRLFNAFYNLVHNAIPEVPAGGSITIRGRMEPARGGVLLSVGDTGRGMPPEVRESLFTSRAISRKPNGTGLGTKPGGRGNQGLHPSAAHAVQRRLRSLTVVPESLWPASPTRLRAGSAGCCKTDRSGDGPRVRIG